METIDYVRYLQAKISVDDRALNQNVLGTLKEIVRPPKEKCTLRVVDIGAGIGAMLHRFLDMVDMFQGYSSVEYSVVDVKQEVLRKSQELLKHRLCTRSSTSLNHDEIGIAPQTRAPSVSHHQSVHHVGLEERRGKDGFHPEDLVVEGSPSITVRFKQTDAQSFLRANFGKFDLVLAAAFLDLFSLDEIMPLVRESLDLNSPIRAFYFPITFDGITRISPVLHEEAGLWDSIIEFFHSSMGNGFASGQKVPRSHSGRHLSTAISNASGRVSAAGPSIWKVEKDAIFGTYLDDEAYFLECILLLIQSAMTDEFYSRICRSTVEKIFTFLKTQLKNSTLMYEAHNIDVCGVF